MHAYEPATHNFGVYTHQAKRVKSWQKMPLTSEHFSYALSMITSESGPCLAWKTLHPNTYLHVFLSDVAYHHRASFFLKQMHAFNLSLIDGACSSCLSRKAHGAVGPSQTTLELFSSHHSELNPERFENRAFALLFLHALISLFQLMFAGCAPQEVRTFGWESWCADDKSRSDFCRSGMAGGD